MVGPAAERGRIAYLRAVMGLSGRWASSIVGADRKMIRYRPCRLAEAEPLMRRMVAVVIDFERRTGHPHPHRDAALGNYARLLAATGKSEAEITAALADVTAGGT